METEQPGVATYLDQKLAFERNTQPTLQSINRIIQDIADGEQSVDTFQAIMKNKIPEQNKVLQVSKTAEKVDILKSYMLKYSKTSAEEI